VSLLLHPTARIQQIVYLRASNLNSSSAPRHLVGAARRQVVERFGGVMEPQPASVFYPAPPASLARGTHVYRTSSLTLILGATYHPVAGSRFLPIGHIASLAYAWLPLRAPPPATHAPLASWAVGSCFAIALPWAGASHAPRDLRHSHTSRNDCRCACWPWRLACYMP
jgi:hypothetical protein